MTRRPTEASWKSAWSSAAVTSQGRGQTRFKMGSENVICWNVRGLNERSHHDSVCKLVRSEHASLICLQETKLSVISDYDVAQILGSGFDYFFLLAVHGA
jgi:hypothetical protein